MCEDQQRLRKLFDEAADAFSRVIPDIRRQESLGVSVDVEALLTSAIEHIEGAQAHYERHLKEHRC
jgi:hypothetical protein